MNLLLLEFLKLRRTLVWPVVLGLPLVPALMNTMIFHSRRFEEAEWMHVLNNGMTTWWLLMMPLVVSLLAAQLLGLEHGSGGWRLQFAAPRPRTQVLGIKFLVCFLLLSLASLVVAATVSLGAGSLGAHLSGSPDWPALMTSLLLSLLGTLSVLALTFFVALRFPSFLAPLGVGVVGMVLGFVGINSQAFGPWWPWTFPLLLSSPVSHFDMTLPLLFNGVMTACFVALSVWEVQRRDA